MKKARSQHASGGNQYNPAIVCIIYSLLFFKKKLEMTGLLVANLRSHVWQTGAEFKNKLKIPWTTQGKEVKPKLPSFCSTGSL